MKNLLSYKSLILMMILLISQSSCTLFNVDMEEEQVVQRATGPTKITMENSFGSFVCSIRYDENGFLSHGDIQRVGGGSDPYIFEKTSSSTMLIGEIGAQTTYTLQNDRITGYDNGDTKLSLDFDEEGNITEVLKQNYNSTGLENVLIHQYGYNDENQMYGAQGNHNLSDRIFSVSAARTTFSSYENPIYEIRDLWITVIASYANHDAYVMALSPSLMLNMETNWTNPQETEVLEIQDIRFENGRVNGFTCPGAFGLNTIYTFEY